MVCQPNGYIDMTAAAMEVEHAEALRLVLEDPGTDMVILISVPPTFLPALAVAERISPVIRSSRKPVAVCFMRGEAMLPARQHLEANGTPTFDTPERAARALIHLNQAAAIQRGTA
jgi:acetyltransferase